MYCHTLSWAPTWTCCHSTLLQTSHPKLVPDRADSSSEDNKLSTQARNDSSVVSWVSLHPILNSFLPRKASPVRMRSWINYIRPILIQWLPAMLRCVAAPRLKYAWTRVCSIESECPSPKLSIKPWVSANTDKPTQTCMHVNAGHHHLRQQIPAASGGSAQTQRERPNLAGAPKLCNSDGVSMSDPDWKVMLSGRTNHTRVESISFFVPDWICRVGMVI